MTSIIEPPGHLVLLLLALLCLGIWINTYQAQAGRWRFELFAVDFGLGAFLFSICAALALGSYGTDLPFGDRLLVSSKTAQVLTLAAGFIFGVGNTLLLGAVSLLGIAGAFAISGGVALTVGLALNRPTMAHSTLLLSAGLFLLASLLGILACRSVEPPLPSIKGQPLGPIRLRRSTKGILVAVLGGTAMSVSYPLARHGAFDEFGLGPYAGLFQFCAGVLIINVIFSLYFFNIALEGGALKLSAYLRNWPGRHLPGIVGGAIWCAGALGVLLAQTGSAADTAANASSYLPLYSVPLAIALGVVLWRDFVKGRRVGLLFILVALVALVGGVTLLGRG